MWSRIVATYTQYYVAKEGWAWFAYFNSYLIFSELIPVFVIAYQINTRTNNKQKTLQIYNNNSMMTDPTKPTDLSLEASHLEYNFAS